MYVAIAQINTTLGDLDGNSQKILAAAQKASQKNADILLTHELSLTGYFPEDLLLSSAFLNQIQVALNALTQKLASLKGLHVLVGHPAFKDNQCYNACSVLYEGQVLKTYYKRHLNDFFNETRYFKAGQTPVCFSVKNTQFALLIGSDCNLPSLLQKQDANVLLVLSASPYFLEEDRLSLFKDFPFPVIYANAIGGQDDIVYDGNSFAKNQENVLKAAHCQEDFLIVEIENKTLQLTSSFQKQSLEEKIYQALVLGTRDYILKNNFNGAILGLSGGVDSALVLAIAHDALGKDKVRVAMMPSEYTASISTDDAVQMAQNLSVHYDIIPIKPCFNTFKESLATPFLGLKEDVTEENLQARIRGTLLMALSNKTGGLVLTTGNKSESAVGYCTLYGDMAGGFAVICDIPKTLVYRLCHYRNQLSDIIPHRILTRAPSAELRPNQTDQDSLPPYDVLDAIIERFVEKSQSAKEIINAGFDETTVKRVMMMIRKNEYKRHQAPLGIRITKRGFGRQWHYPITSKFGE